MTLTPGFAQGSDARDAFLDEPRDEYPRPFEPFVLVDRAQDQVVGRVVGLEAVDPVDVAGQYQVGDRYSFPASARRRDRKSIFSQGRACPARLSESMGSPRRPDEDQRTRSGDLLTPAPIATSLS
jgi:hypothetical protein